MSISIQQPPQQHRIDLAPAYRAGKGKFLGHEKAQMTYRDVVIGESRTPLFSAARYLLANGLARPHDEIATYRENVNCLSGLVGVAAGLTVEDNEHRLAFAPYQEFAEALAA